MIGRKIKKLKVNHWGSDTWTELMDKTNLLIEAHNERINGAKLDIFPRDVILKEKNYYFVNSKGAVCSSTTGAIHTPARKVFGNYFKTQKEAKKVRERMIKLFERVRKGKQK